MVKVFPSLSCAHLNSVTSWICPWYSDPKPIFFFKWIITSWYQYTASFSVTHYLKRRMINWYVWEMGRGWINHQIPIWSCDVHVLNSILAFIIKTVRVLWPKCWVTHWFFWEPHNSRDIITWWYYKPALLIITFHHGNLLTSSLRRPCIHAIFFRPHVGQRVNTHSVFWELGRKPCQHATRGYDKRWMTCIHAGVSRSPREHASVPPDKRHCRQGMSEWNGMSEWIFA